MYIYIIGVAILYLGFGPISNFIDQTLGRSLQLGDFTSRFDYDTIIDLINHYKPGVNVSINAILSTIIPYWLWSIFSTGGILKVSENRNVRSSTLKFWSGGAEFFFRFLRLKIYIFFLLMFLLGLCYFYFSKDGLSPLKLETEGMLISRFKFIICLMTVVGFFISIFKSVAQVLIFRHAHDPFIFAANKEAIRKFFTTRFIFLSILNLLFLLLGMALYLLLKRVLGDMLVALIIVGQLFLIYRIVYRYVRLSSFNYAVE